MAKSAGFVSTSANSEGTSVNNVTLPGNILRHRQWRTNVRPTSANCPERTNMFVNFGYVGGESVYRGLSGNIGKRTQENASPSGFSRGTSAIFVNVPRFIVFYRLFIGNLTHTKDPRQTHDVSGVGWVYSVVGGRESSFTHRLSSGMFGSTSGLIRPEIGGEWLYPRWFTIYRLTIGLESKLHRVLLPIPGNIGCLPWQKSLSYRYNIAYMWMLPRYIFPIMHFLARCLQIHPEYHIGSLPAINGTV